MPEPMIRVFRALPLVLALSVHPANRDVSAAESPSAVRPSARAPSAAFSPHGPDLGVLGKDGYGRRAGRRTSTGWDRFEDVAAKRGGRPACGRPKPAADWPMLRLARAGRRDGRGTAAGHAVAGETLEHDGDRLLIRDIAGAVQQVIANCPVAAPWSIAGFCGWQRKYLLVAHAARCGCLRK